MPEEITVRVRVSPCGEEYKIPKIVDLIGDLPHVSGVEEVEDDV